MPTTTVNARRPLARSFEEIVQRDRAAAAAAALMAHSTCASAGSWCGSELEEVSGVASTPEEAALSFEAALRAALAEPAPAPTPTARTEIAIRPPSAWRNGDPSRLNVHSAAGTEAPCVRVSCLEEQAGIGGVDVPAARGHHAPGLDVR